jgi:hypothetical protein
MIHSVELYLFYTFKKIQIFVEILCMKVCLNAMESSQILPNKKRET